MNRVKLFATGVLIALTAVLLVGCGGGGGGGSNGGNGGTNDAAALAALFTVDPSTVTVSSTTSTSPFILPGGPAFVSFGTSSLCSTTVGTYSTLETANAIIYNDNTNSVSAADLDSVARYTESSLQTLRAKFSIPGTVGFDGTNKLRVCARAPAGGGSNGTAGFNDLYVEINSFSSKNLVLAQLIKHEMTHVVQAQAMNCQTHQYGYERWLTEGMALRSAGQDLPAKAGVSALQTVFQSLNPSHTPFDDIDNTQMPDFNRYPGYRLAYDSFLGTLGKTDVDVYNFLKDYATNNGGCPTNTFGSIPATGWKSAFDTYFSADLRGTGSLGSTFWSIAPTYAK